VKSSFDNYLKQFGKKINVVRKAKRITQFQLASLCDLDIRTIQRIEKGEFNPSLKILIKLALAFNLPLSEIIIPLENPDSNTNSNETAR